MGTKQERLEAIRKHLGLNKGKMAELMGIDQSYYGHILRNDGRGNLRLEQLERLLQSEKVNPVWLMTGNGDMILRISQEIEWDKEPTEDQVEALYFYTIGEYANDMSSRQRLMFKMACAQCYYDNEELKTLEELSIAARVYLKLILRLPDTNLAVLFDLQKQFRVEQ